MNNTRRLDRPHLLDLLRIELALAGEFAQLAHILSEELGDAFTADRLAVLRLEGVSEGGDNVRWVLRSWCSW